MAFPIEILTTEKTLIPQLVLAIQPLNKVQDEFRFDIAKDKLLEEAFNFQQEAYTNTQVARWLENYRSKTAGNRPYLILIINKPLSGTLINLFGGHDAEKGLAWFTIESFNKDSTQFVFDKTRFCRYYLVRYILSFVNPKLKSHDSIGCMFDNKHYKPKIRESYDTGKICDPCLQELRSTKLFNADIGTSIYKLLGVVSNQYPRALVMKGGGVKGLALVGALMELEKYFTFDAFAGTSAGAIAATLLGAGYEPSELKEILYNKDFNDFRSNILFRALSFIVRQSFNDGAHFREWMDELLQRKLKNQVSDVKMKDLTTRAIVYATTVKEGLLRFDSAGERKETTAAFATRCSMSIPLFFKPEKIEGVKVYDGGLGFNFPLRTFLHDNGNSLFIGLYLISDVKKNGTFYTDLRDIVTDADERQVVDANLDKIVIIDPRPIETTNFNLRKKDKEYLMQAGKVGALNYLHKYHPDFQISAATVQTEQLLLTTMRENLDEPEEFAE